MDNKKYDLEDRLVNYTCLMIDVVDALPNTRAGNYIAGQLIRSCHAPTLIMAKLRQQNLQKILFIRWALF